MFFVQGKIFKLYFEMILLFAYIAHTIAHQKILI